MTYTLPLTQRRVLHRRAYAAQLRGGREVCGALLLGKRRSLSLVFLRNRAAGPATFSLDHGEFLEAVRKARTMGASVIGMFHSHPGGYSVPGPRDMREGFYRNVALIYDVIGMRARVFRRRLEKGRFIAQEVALEVEPGPLRVNRRTLNPRLGTTLAA